METFSVRGGQITASSAVRRDSLRRAADGHQARGADRRLARVQAVRTGPCTCLQPKSASGSRRTRLGKSPSSSRGAVARLSIGRLRSHGVGLQEWRRRPRRFAFVGENRVRDFVSAGCRGRRMGARTHAAVDGGRSCRGVGRYPRMKTGSVQPSGDAYEKIRSCATW